MTRRTTRRHPHRRVDVRERVHAEPGEQVVPGRQPHDRSSLWTGSGRVVARRRRADSGPGAAPVSEYAMARVILGRETSASRPRPAGVGGGRTRVRALLSVANRDGIAALARDLLALDVEVFATDGTREHLAADGHRGRLRLGPDRPAGPDRRPGQDLPPRDLCRHPRPARRRGPDGGARRARASARSTSSSSTSPRSPPRSAPSSSGSTRRSR